VSSLVITIKTANSRLAELVGSSSSRSESTNALARFLEACATGHEHAAIYTGRSTSNPVAASGTITCAAVNAADTVTIGKTTLTASATPANENEFDQSGTNTADAESLAAKINAHSVLSKLVSASAASGVVTVTALEKSALGNHIALASSNGTRLAVTGSGYLASGTGGHEIAGATISQGV